MSLGATVGSYEYARTVRPGVRCDGTCYWVQESHTANCNINYRMWKPQSPIRMDDARRSYDPVCLKIASDRQHWEQQTQFAAKNTCTVQLLAHILQ